MKAKTLLAALFVAGIVVSVAIAAPAEKGHGKNGTTTSTVASTDGTTGTTTTVESKGKAKGKANQACKPRRSVVLRGTFVAAGGGGFAMQVTGGNRLGKKLADKQVTVLVDEKTKFRRRGKAALADFVAGDWLNVQGRACRLDEQAMTLLARRVVGKLATSDDGEDEGTTTGTTTGTTADTTTGTTTDTTTGTTVSH